MELLPSDAGNLLGLDTGRRALSHTSISSLLNCARRYELGYVERLEPFRRPEPLSLGRAYQLSIEAGDPAVGAEALRYEAATPASQPEEDALRVREQVIYCASRAYLEQWGHEPQGVREYGYRVRLRNPATGRYSNTFDLLGYADELIDRADHLELVENKLVGAIDAASIRRLPLDRQVTLACYGTWRATGKFVRVVHYRLMRKPSIKQRKGESIENYLARIDTDYRERGTEFYMRAESVFRSADDLLRIEAELWEWADELRRYEQRSVWPRNTSHCHDYGGCPFIPICVGDPDARALYRRKPTRTQDRAHLEAA